MSTSIEPPRLVDVSNSMSSFGCILMRGDTIDSGSLTGVVVIPVYLLIANISLLNNCLRIASWNLFDRLSVTSTSWPAAPEYAKPRSIPY